MNDQSEVMADSARGEGGGGSVGESVAGFGPSLGQWTVVGVFAALVLGVWLFPQVWYRSSDPEQAFVWFAEQTNVVGWRFRPLPVAESAEATLAADRLFSGEYEEDGGRRVAVFSAKRYRENMNEIGLFVHTPDRCWTEAGWKIAMEPESADVASLTVHGMRLVFERRVFASGVRRDLVYFGGLVGGQALPYRLDHNLSVGLRHQRKESADTTGSTLRASDRRLWQRVWDSFGSRRRLLGPKQFVRVSTEIEGGDVVAADRRLQEFLPLWLGAVDYSEELKVWQGSVR